MQTSKDFCALGAYCRFQISAWFAAWLGKGFPYGTLFVNVLGSFIMGLLVGAIKMNAVPFIPWHDFIGEGFLGALTTFSTFSMDTFAAFRDGQPGKAIATSSSIWSCASVDRFRLFPDASVGGRHVVYRKHHCCPVRRRGGGGSALQAECRDHERPDPGFPLGILCINVLGGFLMGLLQGAMKRSGNRSRWDTACLEPAPRRFHHLLHLLARYV